MELRQLVYFEAVARLGGFSRAAEQVHIAQPAISAQIRHLERELGTALFERITRRVGLTQAGPSRWPPPATSRSSACQPVAACTTS